MFVPLSKILPRAAGSLGMKRQLEAALICEKYRKLAPRLVHANALKHTFPKYYRDGTLTIGMQSSAWAGQVVKSKQSLLDAINKELGRKTVINIKTSIVQETTLPTTLPT